MPRERTKPINSFIQQLMDQDPPCSQLTELVERYPALDRHQIYKWADVDGNHQTLQALLRDAGALGLSVDEFVRGLLGVSDTD